MFYALPKIAKFHLIFSCGNFVKRHSFLNVSGDLQKLCISTKFQHQEIRWNYGILRSDRVLSTFLVNSSSKITFKRFAKGWKRRINTKERVLPRDVLRTIFSSQFHKILREKIQWTLSNSNSQGEFEFVWIMESSD